MYNNRSKQPDIIKASDNTTNPKKESDNKSDLDLKKFKRQLLSKPQEDQNQKSSVKLTDGEKAKRDERIVNNVINRTKGIVEEIHAIRQETNNEDIKTIENMRKHKQEKLDQTFAEQLAMNETNEQIKRDNQLARELANQEMKQWDHMNNNSRELNLVEEQMIWRIDPTQKDTQLIAYMMQDNSDSNTNPTEQSPPNEEFRKLIQKLAEQEERMNTHNPDINRMNSLPSETSISQMLPNQKPRDLRPPIAEASLIMQKRNKDAHKPLILEKNESEPEHVLGTSQIPPKSDDKGAPTQTSEILLAKLKEYLNSDQTDSQTTSNLDISSKTALEGYQDDISINLQDIVNTDISESKFIEMINKKEIKYLESWKEAQNARISNKDIEEEAEEIKERISTESTFSTATHGFIRTEVKSYKDAMLMEEFNEYKKENEDKHRENTKIYNEKMKHFDKISEQSKEYAKLKNEIKGKGSILLTLEEKLYSYIEKNKNIKMDKLHIKRMCESLEVKEKYRESLATLKKWRDTQMDEFKNKVHKERMNEYKSVKNIYEEIKSIDEEVKSIDEEIKSIDEETKNIQKEKIDEENEKDEIQKAVIERKREKITKRKNELVDAEESCKRRKKELKSDLRDKKDIINSKDIFYDSIIEEVFVSSAQPIAEALLKTQEELSSLFHSWENKFSE